MKKIIALILIYSVMLVFLTGCSYIDMIIGNNATGGDETGNADINKDYDEKVFCEGDIHYYYWIETYEDLVEAVERLKTNCNYIEYSLIFDCEGMIYNGNTLDVKFCLRTSRDINGEHFLDVKNAFVYIEWYLCDRYTLISSDMSLSEKRARIEDNLLFTNSGIPSTIGSDTVLEDKDQLFCSPDGFYDVNSGFEDWPYDDNECNDFRVVYKGEIVGYFEAPEGRFPKYSDLPIEFMKELVKTAVIIDRSY